MAFNKLDFRQDILDPNEDGLLTTPKEDKSTSSSELKRSTKDGLNPALRKAIPNIYLTKLPYVESTTLAMRITVPS